MADIRCPNCGKDNPDFLDVCQFCQTSLKPESGFNIGDSPTKKNTGELEAILPAWLQDVRQQGRDSAAEDAIEAATNPLVEKEAPPDLLAGLANQSESDNEEVPDWLAGLNPVSAKELPKPSASENISPSDFFAQFEQSETQPASSAGESVQEETPSWMENEAPAPEQKDELSDWLSQASQQPDEPFRFDTETVQGESWKPPEQEPEESKEPEDLSWLHNLEASAKPSEEFTPQADTGLTPDFNPQAFGQPSDSQDNMDWLKNLGGVSLPAFDESPESQPASSEDDLGWLNNLGGAPGTSAHEETPTVAPESSKDDLDWLKNLGGEATPAFEEPASTVPASSESDLSWLDNLGGTSASAPAFDVPVSAQPSSSQDDLDWLKNLGGETAPAFEEPVSTKPTSSENDLSWLDNLGGTSASAPAFDVAVAAQPSSSSQDDLDWLKNLGGGTTPAFEEPASEQPILPQNDMGGQQNDSIDAPPIFPFSSRDTGPLAEIKDDITPDWLTSATREPSMPAPGAVSMDWFKAQDGQSLPSTPEPASPRLGVPSSGDVNSSISNQDVDSMFAVEMPDWLSQKPDETSDPSSQVPASSNLGGDLLSPVDLPSWVQAMRPVEAAIGEASAGAADQMTEKEGPLAGFRGLIPSAPIGSSRRPKAILLKLQPTDEQQANAVLLEQIIAGETVARPLKLSSAVASQRALRWVLTGLFLIVLGLVIGSGSQVMPVVAPPNVRELSDVVATIPDSVPVLVVIDYEPSLVGELEAASGPLLDQMALSRHSQFIFLSTSPNSSALVERLMANTGINKPTPAGLGYQSGLQYFNIGFLPGGSAGVLEFVEYPAKAMPLIKDQNIERFSKFAAVVILTDHAESSRVWIEQLEQAKQKDSTLAGQKLFIVSSAQSGPLLQPYVSSGQVNAMISGLSDATRYEYINNTRPGIARTYWDAFGVGLTMAVLLIVIGSLWSLVAGIRARRAEAEQG